MDRTDSKSDTPLTQRSSGPVRSEPILRDGKIIGRSWSWEPPARYELIDKDGHVWGGFSFALAATAAEQAKILWPDQEQDPDRTGKGWDVQTVGAK